MRKRKPSPPSVDSGFNWKSFFLSIWNFVKHYAISSLLIASGSVLLGLTKAPLLLIFGGLLTLVGLILSAVISTQRGKEIKKLQSKLREEQISITRERQALFRAKVKFAELLCQTTMAKLVADIEEEQAQKGLADQFKYRVNIMLFDRKGTLGIWVSSSNMEGDPDRNIHFKRGTGCCGRALIEGKYAVASLRGEDVAADYNLDQEQLNLTSHLGAVMSVPLFSGNKVVAVLNVDTTVDLEKSVFGNPKTKEKICKFSNHLGASINQLDRNLWRLFRLEPRE